MPRECKSTKVDLKVRWPVCKALKGYGDWNKDNISGELNLGFKKYDKA